MFRGLLMFLLAPWMKNLIGWNPHVVNWYKYICLITRFVSASPLIFNDHRKIILNGFKFISSMMNQWYTCRFLFSMMKVTSLMVHCWREHWSLFFGVHTSLRHRIWCLYTQSISMFIGDDHRQWCNNDHWLWLCIGKT